MEKKKYPIGAEHYTLYEEVGQGVSAAVHRALCIPFNEIVAIKILDFERDNSDLVIFCFLLIFELALIFLCYNGSILYFFENYVAADIIYEAVWVK